LSNIFFIAGIGLAGYAGYSGLEWYFIFISSLIMAIGWFIMRAPQMYSLVSEDGLLVIPKFLIMQVIIYALICAPIYFVAMALS